MTLGLVRQMQPFGISQADVVTASQSLERFCRGPYIIVVLFDASLLAKKDCKNWKTVANELWIIFTCKFYVIVATLGIISLIVNFFKILQTTFTFLTDTFQTFLICLQPLFQGMNGVKILLRASRPFCSRYCHFHPYLANLMPCKASASCGFNFPFVKDGVLFVFAEACKNFQTPNKSPALIGPT